MVELTYLSLKKNYFFCSYFRHISLCFYLNLDRESLLDAEFDSASNEYPHCILLMDPTTSKIRNTWKKMMMTSSSFFSRYFLFWGQRGPSKVCNVGTRWMQNQIPHPTSSPDRNLIKKTGRYVKNTNKKSSFFYDTYPQIYIKKVFKTYTVFQI